MLISILTAINSHIHFDKNQNVCSFNYAQLRTFKHTRLNKQISLIFWSKVLIKFIAAFIHITRGLFIYYLKSGTGNK
ncbi:hypothetical protein D3C87_733660 [compost metagenome]